MLKAQFLLCVLKSSYSRLIQIHTTVIRIKVGHSYNNMNQLKIVLSKPIG